MKTRQETKETLAGFASDLDTLGEQIRLGGHSAASEYIEFRERLGIEHAKVIKRSAEKAIEIANAIIKAIEDGQ